MTNFNCSSQMHPGDQFFFVILTNYISGKITNKEPTLYLNQHNLQFANNYNHIHISNTDHTNTGNK